MDKLKTKISAITGSRAGKFFFIAALTSVAVLVLLLITGVISFSDLIELNRKMIELCPFCMTT